jgi:peptidoglycan/LPS O-acetylase OafA/YrhL
MQMRTVHSSISYRPDIQGLRAIAIALVVFGHAGLPGLAGGFIGVDVFFVLSGYLITGLLVRERTDTGQIRYIRFLARRLKRLLPVLLVMLVLVLVAASILLSAYEVRMQSGSFLFSTTWTSNLFFAFVERDYFSALQSEDLFLHTWSLGIEEQFYLVWPWLVSLAFLFVANQTDVKRSRSALLGILAGLFVASFLLCLYWSRTQPLLSFYMMPSRGWQFALGAGVFVWFHNLQHSREATARLVPSPSFELPISIVGLVLIIGSAVLLTPDVSYPSYLALFPSIGAAMVIAAGIRSKKGVSSILAHRNFTWLGDHSYSLYLWHWPVLILGGSFGLTNSPVGIASLLGISVFLAVLSYRFVELPFWKGHFRKARPVRAILVSVLAMVAVIGVAEGLKRNVYDPPVQTMTADGYDPRMDWSRAIYDTGLDCDTWYFEASPVPCGIGARDGESLAVLFGDSIGVQWSSLVTGIFSAPDWQVIVLTKSSCAIVDEPQYYDLAGGEYEICRQWRNAAIEYIGDLKPDVVIVGSGSYYGLSDSQWVDGTARVLSKLASAADKVVVVAGTPKLTFDGPSCLEEPYRFSFRLSDSTRECEEALHASNSIDVANYLSLAAAGFDRVSVLDLGDMVCPDLRCSASTAGGMAVFRDSQHLTTTFVNSLIPDARERLVAMGVVAEPGSESTHPGVTDQ